MSDTSNVEPITTTEPSRFRRAETVSNIFNKIMADLENVEKQCATLRKRIEEMRSAL